MAKKKVNEDALEKSLRNSFRENLKQSELKLALLKRNPEYQKFFSAFLDSYKKHREAHDGVWPGKDFAKFGLVGLRFLINHPAYRHDEIIDLVNPQKDINTASKKLVTDILPRLFYDHAVELIEVGKIRHFEEGGHLRPIWIVNERGLKPWERIYKVDLSKKRTQILKEFEGYLERAYLKNAEDSTWSPNNKRDRKEAWFQLKVWDLWYEAGRKPWQRTFRAISKEVGRKESTVKSQWYRAYELINGKPYDPISKYRTEEKRAEADKFCAQCPWGMKCYKKTGDWIPCSDYVRMAGKEVFSGKIVAFDEKILYEVMTT